MNATSAGTTLAMVLAGAVLIGVIYEMNPKIGGLLLFLVVFALLGNAVRRGQLTKGSA